MSSEPSAGDPGLRWSLVAIVSLGVWLHAADALVAATVMPSAVAEIGGVAFIYWTIALYELGSIVAGAVAGVAVVRLGLRRAMPMAALVYALGCVASAVAPDMAVMLGGRLVQGLGGGAMLALSYVSINQLFPEHLWPRVLAFVSSVWGISALVGPLVGGALASVGLWRWAFWAFAAQALVLVALTPVFAGGGSTNAGAGTTVPARQLLILGLGVVAVSAAGVQQDVRGMIVLAGIGVYLLRLVLTLERRAPQRLFPPTPFSAAVAWGPGYVMVLSLATATVSFTVYGPLLMTRLFHVLPVTAGFMVAVESVAWTLAAIAFAGAASRTEPLLIRVGAILIGVGVVGLAFAMPHGPVWAILPWVGLQGAGFGLCWAFLLRRVVSSVPDAERDRASSAIPTLQMIGYAIGAAASGVVANALGLGEHATDDVLRSVAFWIFAAFFPLLAVGVGAAWRVAARAHVTPDVA